MCARCHKALESLAKTSTWDSEVLALMIEDDSLSEAARHLSSADGGRAAWNWEDTPEGWPFWSSWRIHLIGGHWNV